MPSFTLYDILELSKGCSQDDIKKAYKRLAKSNHPDKGGSEDTFKKINDAYNVLSDPNSRRQYDMMGDEGRAGGGGFPFPFGGPGGAAFQDMFRGFDFFGGGGSQGHQQRKEKTSPLVHIVTISIHEAYTGLSKEIRVTSYHACSECITKCVTCQGTGQKKEIRQIGPGMISQSISTCNVCSGTGNSNSSAGTCTHCNGMKKKEKTEMIHMVIPPGSMTGDQIGVPNKGNQDLHKDIGDLIIRIQVNNNLNLNGAYRGSIAISGAHLVYTIGIDMGDALCGFEVTLPHPSEKDGLQIKTKEMESKTINCNKTYIIPRKGMPVKNNAGTFGDVHVKFSLNHQDTNLCDMSAEDAETIASIFAKYKKHAKHTKN
jgi:DnaJ-class molecular chaperone